MATDGLHPHRPGKIALDRALAAVGLGHRRTRATPSRRYCSGNRDGGRKLGCPLESFLPCRLPSVLTFATAAWWHGFCCRQLTGAAWPDHGRRAACSIGCLAPFHPLQTGCLAAALYLLFFPRFAMARWPLTSAPETFWLALPLWVAGAAAARAPDRQARRWGWLAYTLFGSPSGWAAPTSPFGWLHLPPLPGAPCCCLWSAPPVHPARHCPWTGLEHGAGGLACSRLWLCSTPTLLPFGRSSWSPRTPARCPAPRAYWHNALFGAYPMWGPLAYPINAGLLILPTLVWCLQALCAGCAATHAAPCPPWAPGVVGLLVWLVVFTVPSQRSGAISFSHAALAILMALGWERIPAWTF